LNLVKAEDVNKVSKLPDVVGKEEDMVDGWDSMI